MHKKKYIPDEQPLGRILAGIGKEYLRLLNSKLIHLDLEKNYYTLIIIDKSHEQITQQELSNKSGLDKVSIVRIIDYLSSKGYVERVRNNNDRRKYSLKLTKKATLILPEIKNKIEETTRIALLGLEKDEINNFYKTLNIINNNIKK